VIVVFITFNAEISSIRDLGVQINSLLNFISTYLSLLIRQIDSFLWLASHLCIWMLACYQFYIHRSLVWPILEYVNLVWEPFFIADQQQIEKVQRRATQLITWLFTLSFHTVLVLNSNYAIMCVISMFSIWLFHFLLQILFFYFHFLLFLDSSW